MGSKASKPAQAATRKFPTRAPGSAPPPAPRSAAPPPRREAPAPARHEQPSARAQASYTKDDAIRQDASDPDPQMDATFSQRLRQMGVATPNPTLSNSSTAGAAPMPASFSASPLRPQFPAPSANTTLGVLEARRQIQERFEMQAQNPSAAREFLDVGIIKQVLVMRERGSSVAEIEKRLRLKPGLVEQVGSRQIVTPMTL